MKRHDLPQVVLMLTTMQLKCSNGVFAVCRKSVFNSKKDLRENPACSVKTGSAGSTGRGTGSTGLKCREHFRDEFRLHPGASVSGRNSLRKYRPVRYYRATGRNYRAVVPGALPGQVPPRLWSFYFLEEVRPELVPEVPACRYYRAVP